MAAPPAQALRLAAPFSDHMVIQQKRPLKLRGFAAPKTDLEATLSPNDPKVTPYLAVAGTRSDANGLWTLTLPPTPAGGPYALEIKGGGQTLKLEDVLCGEVWLASGQSNMEWPMDKATGPSPEALKLSHPHLRLLNVPHKVGSQGDPYEGLSWTQATPATQAPFSAVAFHFADALQRKLKVPVGIINASWSGTNGEAWTPLSAIEEEPKLAPILERYDKLPDAQKQMYRDGWPFWLEFGNLCLIAGNKKNYILPQVWTTDGAEGSRSAVDLHRDAFSRYSGVLPPGAWAAAKGRLNANNDPVDLSRVDEITFEARGNSTFDLAFAQDTIQDGDQPCSPAFETNDRVQEFRFRPALFQQQGWGRHELLNLSNVKTMLFRVHSPNQFPDQPGLLFDSMIKPLAGFELAGALWYQGESNVSRAAEYVHLLRALVKGWRSALGPELGFVVVQLPEYDDPINPKGQWEELQRAQATVLGLKGTGLVSTKGLGELKDVHPRLKEPVGVRAAEVAVGLDL